MHMYRDIRDIQIEIAIEIDMAARAHAENMRSCSPNRTAKHCVVVGFCATCALDEKTNKKGVISPEPFEVQAPEAMAVRVRLLSGAVVWEGERPPALAALRAAVARAMGAEVGELLLCLGGAASEPLGSSARTAILTNEVAWGACESAAALPLELVAVRDPALGALEEFLKEQTVTALNFASVNLKSDRDFVLAAVKDYLRARKITSAELRAADRELMLAALEECGWAQECASTELQADREVVLAALEESGEVLEYASAELRADRELVLAAVTQYGGALAYASAELLDDRELVLAAVKQSGKALVNASAELQANRELVLAAVTQYGGALAFASAELQADRELVLVAVTQNGGALAYASAELQADRELVLAAVTQSCGAPTREAS